VRKPLVNRTFGNLYPYMTPLSFEGCDKRWPSPFDAVALLLDYPSAALGRLDRR